jgi:hypothetical protein
VQQTAEAIPVNERSTESQPEPSAPAAVTAAPASFVAAASELQEQAPGDAAAGPTTAQLRDFFLGRPGGDDRAAATAPSQLVSAHLFAYRRRGTFRHDYPLCLSKDAAEPATPLSTLVDRWTTEHAGDDADAAERLRRILLSVESHVRQQVDAGADGALPERWGAALEEVQQGDRGDRAAEALAVAASVTVPDATVISCGSSTPDRLFCHFARAAWRQRRMALATEISETIARLEQLQEAAFARSAAAHSAEHVGASLGIGGIDPAALAAVTGSGAGADADESDARAARIAETISTLKEAGTALLGENEVLAVNAGAAAGAEQLTAERSLLTQLSRARRLASLELANRYDPARHDQLFARFSAVDLAPESEQLCPPVLVSINAADVDDALYATLAAGGPVKVLVHVDQPFTAVGLVTEQALRAVVGHDTFVLQSSVATVSHLLSGLQRGLATSGPAVFFVYAADYLTAAAVVESRLFPAFCSDPGAGPDWADRFSVDGTPAPTDRWSTGDLAIRRADGTSAAQQLPFTPVDWLAEQQHASQDFLLLPADLSRPDLHPYGSDGELHDSEDDVRLPCVPLADAQGMIWAAVPRQTVCTQAERVAALWRTLQEFAGIKNSHARAAMAAQAAQLAAEHEEALAAAEAAHAVACAELRETLTQSVLAQLAAGLLQQGVPALAATAAAGTAGSTPAPAPPAADSGAAAATDAGDDGADDEDDDEDDADLGAPYIDSPLCTTCNECVNLNNQLFAYNDSKQAYIQDAAAGTYRELVEAAERCTVKIIHPGAPLDPDEPGLDELQKRAEPYQ